MNVYIAVEKNNDLSKSSFPKQIAKWNPTKDILKHQCQQHQRYTSMLIKKLYCSGSLVVNASLPELSSEIIRRKCQDYMSIKVSKISNNHFNAVTFKFTVKEIMITGKTKENKKN